MRCFLSFRFFASIELLGQYYCSYSAQPVNKVVSMSNIVFSHMMVFITSRQQYDHCSWILDFTIGIKFASVFIFILNNMSHFSKLFGSEVYNIVIVVLQWRSKRISFISLTALDLFYVSILACFPINHSHVWYWTWLSVPDVAKIDAVFLMNHTRHRR